MTFVDPLTVSMLDGTCVVTPGTEYENVYENMLGNFDGVIDFVRRRRPTRLVFDLRHVRFVGSAFLSLLLRMSMCVSRNRRGSFAIRNPSPFCREALKTTRLNRLLNVCDEASEASC